jgi:hypothetical protein
VRRIFVPWAWEVKVMHGCGIPRGFWLKPVRSVDKNLFSRIFRDIIFKKFYDKK